LVDEVAEGALQGQRFGAEGAGGANGAGVFVPQRVKPGSGLVSKVRTDTCLMMGLLMMGFAVRSGGSRSMSWFAWWPLMGAVLSAALSVAEDIGFIVWSRKKLRSSFREEASRSLGQPRFVMPSPLPSAPEAPPVIAAQP
jgi:hypothetical protein